MNQLLSLGIGVANAVGRRPFFKGESFMNVLSRSMIIAMLAISHFAMAQEAKKSTTTTTTVVVEQPTTRVEASPLEESNAERMRRLRQENELQTEQKIVEKLEASRLEDEKKRADRLFGNRTDGQEQVQQMPQQQVVVPTVVTPVIVEEQKASSSELSSAKKEIIDAIKEEKADGAVVMQTPIEETSSRRYFISGLVGTSEYGSAVNIEGRGSAGFVLGFESDENLTLEGSFIYSNYYMSDYRWITGEAVFRELDQYGIGATAKYHFMTGRIKPFVSGSAAFVHRKYADRLAYGWSGGYLPNDSEATSNAIDLGIGLGVEFAVTEGFSLGLEYRYATNVMNRSDSDILDRQYRAPGVRLVEETDYSSLLLSGKVRF